eukprot:CAMPEP_0174384378 /NCGR_PEP_ID=MMETSP0811_2-20130205/125878_1 /TAXON_ID=73025 ORGANISM="Eutreptiella gymnastica-like, Strain CCMP1594" /NCGR_SAMPLE_ID=MMETSP0811_2 /ASSEMBLY_ACC=CAM_ASM_000667 /LENGTH=63 /DNA_ID=CAMNT_0015538313 /DNA_START=1297 /DNA_END=1488 /DNA_ORIENTATION=+
MEHSDSESQEVDGLSDEPDETSFEEPDSGSGVGDGDDVKSGSREYKFWQNAHEAKGGINFGGV